jgi:twitching motility protein PilI
MAKASLREYQRELAERLRHSVDSKRSVSKLGVQVGQASWLVDLTDAGEVLPVPQIAAVPLTKPWFRGMANIRGNLYSVVDFSAFLGGKAVSATDQARLLLVGDRLRTGAALLVERSLGLRNADQLTAREKSDADGAEQAAWVKAEYADADGKEWIELDVAQLVQHPEFLGVAA